MISKRLPAWWPTGGGSAGEDLSLPALCYPIETRVIDVHIRNLRRKIETQPSRPYYILAVPGIDYRFTNARPT